MPPTPPVDNTKNPSETLQLLRGGMHKDNTLPHPTPLVPLHTYNPPSSPHSFLRQKRDNVWSYPRKEKNSKPPTGENGVPSKQNNEGKPPTGENKEEYPRRNLRGSRIKKAYSMNIQWCQWSLEFWSSQRIDSNRIIDLTIKIDSNLRVESILRIDSALRINSTLRIDSTDLLI